MLHRGGFYLNQSQSSGAHRVTWRQMVLLLWRLQPFSCEFGLPWCKLSIHWQQEMKCEMPLINHCTDILTLKLLACQYFGAHSVIFPKYVTCNVFLAVWYDCSDLTCFTSHSFSSSYLLNLNGCCFSHSWWWSTPEIVDKAFLVIMYPTNTLPYSVNVLKLGNRKKNVN